jgi:hypothetical protein
MAGTAECRGFDMAFDVLSFLAGIAAGGLTGAFAAVLYGLERTADFQERLLGLSREIESIRPNLSSSTASKEAETKTRVYELRRELEDIHEEIRRMYKRSTR